MSGLILHLTAFEDPETAVAHYLKRIDDRAEEARSLLITSSPGQTMTYEAKYQEAERYPQGVRFPFLEAEAAALEMTVQEVVDSVLTARTQWEDIGAQIEATRLKAKKDIGLAGTTMEMHEITRVAFLAWGV